MNEKDFAWKVLEGEGLDYAIMDYFSSDDPDIPEEIREDWADAEKALRRIREHLERVLAAAEEPEAERD